MATTKKTTETTFNLEGFLQKLVFVDAHEKASSKAGVKALEALQEEFNLPSFEGRIQVDNYKDPAEGRNFLSRKWWAGFLFPGQTWKPGEGSPLPQRIQTLCALLGQQKTQKTQKADFVGGSPPKSNPTFISIPKYKKVPVENREKELKRLLRPILLIPGLGPDAAFHLKCLCDGTVAQKQEEQVPENTPPPPEPKPKKTGNGPVVSLQDLAAQVAAITATLQAAIAA